MFTQKITKDMMEKSILKHGKNLNSIFDTGYANGFGGAKLLGSRLLKLEKQARELALHSCNGEPIKYIENYCTKEYWRLYGIESEMIENDTYSEDDIYTEIEKIIDREIDKIVSKVAKILNTSTDNIYFNGDPRGFALKFSEDFSRTLPTNFYKDLGGYGIIAPDFRIDIF
tara:strand:- start:59 stop:571 length:513 start_codon:yes stop_codon:yes gene_type:complete